MRTETPKAIRLEDYRPPDWLVEWVELDVRLNADATAIHATLHLKPNPETAPAPLVLDGDGLTPLSVALDGELLSEERYVATPDSLSIPQPPARPFRLEIETVVDPSANTQLMGLYRSHGVYCTQCEAEGFRRITYFPDRPDVMAVHTTRIEAKKSEAPVLLSNGNLVEAGAIAGTDRHYAVWHDPFPKPSYLFALVGGALACVEDKFVTISGRTVALRIYVEHGKEDRCTYAMDSLKRAMRWDEEAFGREYDLDVFMIVAVSDFNMGAMENKGLNIFNDKYVLASSETATDADYAQIEAIIAHEYFHNWTGNRITCRDWFQLCLKEGLTVFRDQEFSSDQRSRAVKRIADVRLLRSHQFVEDAGPLAHPVRPTTYREINNFYTATVYEKGAEIIRMLKTLIGAEDFRKGMDLYFKRHDGRAATIEEFVQCFAEASGRDLGQFMLWYAQAGTPEVTVSTEYDSRAQTLRLDLVQTAPPTPGQPSKEPMVIPLAFGLVGPEGRDMPVTASQEAVARDLIVLRKAAESITFNNVAARPVLSLNRGFSAPIKLNLSMTAADLTFLAAHDPDPFNRWQAVQTIATGLLLENTTAIRAQRSPREDAGLLDALTRILHDEALEPAFVALVLAMPSETDIARESGRDVDPDAIFAARSSLRESIGRSLWGVLRKTYERLHDRAPYSPDAASAGRRALKNACLDLLAATREPAAIALSGSQHETADNMTDRMAALTALALHAPAERRERALRDFFGLYQKDALVIDKWFALQASIPEPATLDHVQALMRHPAFEFSNPNRLRALVGSFAQANQTQFNRPDGRGYDFVADVVLSLDPMNPQLAARLLSSFKSWRVLEDRRRERAEAALRRVAATEILSRDVRDIVMRSLDSDPNRVDPRQ